MKNLSKFSAPLPHCGEKKKRRSEDTKHRGSILRAFGGKGCAQRNWAWLDRKILGGLAGLLETEARHSKQL